MWDLSAGGKKLHEMQCEREVSSLALTSDDARIISGDDSGKVTVWDLSAGGKKLHEMQCGDWCSSLALTSDDARIISGDHTAR